jgi:hypothetical protein
VSGCGRFRLRRTASAKASTLRPTIAEPSSSSRIGRSISSGATTIASIHRGRRPRVSATSTTRCAVRQCTSSSGRAKRDGDLGTPPYFYAGPMPYESHTGDRPMRIRWRLAHPRFRLTCTPPPELASRHDLCMTIVRPLRRYVSDSHRW